MKLRNASIAKEDVIDAAVMLIKQHGVAQLSLRSVARAVGVNVSVVSHMFGGLEALHRAVYQDVARQGLLLIKSSKMAFGISPRDLRTLPGTMMALIDHIIRDQNKSFLILNEYRELLSRGKFENHDQQQNFWESNDREVHDILNDFNQTVSHFSFWFHFIIGVVAHAHTDQNPISRSAWISSLCQRLSDRVERRLPSLRPPEVVVEYDIHEPNWPAGKMKIVRATIDVINEFGLDEVTHRRVAEVAGTSLASTTYFFKSKSELIEVSLREIVRRSMKNVISLEYSSAHERLQSIYYSGSEQVANMYAIQAVYSAASRDDKLQDLSQAIHATRGYNAMRWLATKAEIVEIDRIDGLIWTLTQSGIFQFSYLIDVEDRLRFLEESYNRLTRELFRYPD